MLKVRTNRMQYAKLVDLLCERPDIANGIPQKGQFTKAREFWDEVAVELNSIGPPEKDSRNWRKVWLDYKCYIKKKLAHNKKSSGGSFNKTFSFSNVEEEVIKLLGLNTNTNEIEGVSKFGTPNQLSSEDITQELQASTSQPPTHGSISEPPSPTSQLSSYSPSQLSNSSRRTIISKSTTKAHLKEQLEIQKQILKEHGQLFEESLKSFKSIHSGVEKLCDLEKAKLDEMKRHNKKKEEMIAEKIQIKKQLLELKKYYFTLRSLK